MLIDRFWDSFITWTLAYLALALVGHFFVYRLNFVRKRKIQNASEEPGSIRRQLAWSFLYVLTISGRAVLLLWLGLSGWTRIYLDMDRFGIPYLMASVLVYLIGFDLYFYSVHRLLHWGPLYRHIHSVHHRVSSPSVFTIFCMHPLEAVIFCGYHVVMLMILPLHPLALTIIALVIHQANIVGHFGYELFPRSFARRIPFISSATYHDIHHQTAQHNYAYFFNWLDWIFKTAKADYKQIYEKTFARENKAGLQSENSVN